MKFRKLKVFGKNRYQPIEKHVLYFEMKDANSSGQCPICFLLDKKERQHIASIFYEHVTDPEVREMLRKAKGLCTTHVNLFLKYGDALGLAIFANDVVCHLIETNMRHIESTSCPFCQFNDQIETRLGLAFTEYLVLDEFWKTLENSVGLCLKHYHSIYQLTSDQQLKLRLLNFQKGKFAQHQALLASFIEKNNYTVPHDEITNDEARNYQFVWNLLIK